MTTLPLVAGATSVLAQVIHELRGERPDLTLPRSQYSALAS
ncbi:hypothetical protein ACGFWI_00290 [Streptomyces sp. NPDC048434]